MSNRYQVYIGPFLICRVPSTGDPDIYALTDDSLQELRGDLSVLCDEPGVHYWAPAKGMGQTFVDGLPQQEPLDFSISTAVNEMMELGKIYSRQIETLRKHFTVEIRWGAVPGKG